MSNYASVPQPQNVTLRDLQKGMILHLPAQLLPLGAAVDLTNLAVTHGGLKRAVPFTDFQIDGTPEEGDYLKKVELVYTSVNELENVAFGSLFLYSLGDDSKTLSRISFGLEFTADPTDASIAYDSSDNTWIMTVPVGFDLSKVQRGDRLVIDTDLFPIEVVLGQSIVFADPNGYLDSTIDDGNEYSSFEIYFSWGASPPYDISYAIVPKNIFIADRSVRGLIAYNEDDGMREIPFSQETDVSSINAVLYHDYRLFLGGVTIDGLRYPGRIIWSTRSSPYDPAFQQIEDETFSFDCVGSTTEILRMLSLDTQVVVYFRDAIFVGRPTNVVGLPYNFLQLDSGGIGVAGSLAVCSIGDGHFFVGQDDIYFLSANGSLQKIGSPVIPRTIEAYASSLDRTECVVDTAESRVLFLFKNASGNFEEAWAFNYQYQAWYRLDLSGQSMTRMTRVFSKTWADYPQGNPHDSEFEMLTTEGTWADPALAGLTWQDFNPSKTLNRLFLLRDNQMHIVDQTGSECSVRGQSPNVLWESGDMDFDKSDEVKTVTRLTLKLEEPFVIADGDDPSTALVFEVFASSNRGRTWKRCGTIRIGEGEDEGKVNFQSTGSLFRFRIRSNSTVGAYKITEVGVRARLRGLETSY